MPPVDYLSGARRDFDESFDWYAERSADAAVRFAAAVDAALAKIAADPTRFASSDWLLKFSRSRVRPHIGGLQVIANNVLSAS